MGNLIVFIELTTRNQDKTNNANLEEPFEATADVLNAKPCSGEVQDLGVEWARAVHSIGR